VYKKGALRKSSSACRPWITRSSGRTCMVLLQM
jgi:hypothetical protein